MDPRSYDNEYPPHEEGKPYVVRLIHRDTKVMGVGEGPDIDTAQARALEALQAAVEEHDARRLKLA